MLDIIAKVAFLTSSFEMYWKNIWHSQVWSTQPMLNHCWVRQLQY